jgi:hypothetical protein
MDYREADDLVFEITRADATPMFAGVAGTAFPNSYQAMFGFYAKTNLLKTALFDMVDSENPYAFKVLFRCLCEHHLKFMYVWTRFLKEKTDDVGTEYFTYCGASELREYAGALVLSQSLVGTSVVANVEEAIAKTYPKIASMSAKELEKGAAQFRYRAILRFLSQQMPGAFGTATSFLPTIVPAYAELSSFVHGGPACDREMRSFGHPKAVEDCRERAEVVFMMAASILMLMAMAVSREFPKYGALAGKVKAVLDAFRDTPKATPSETPAGDDSSDLLFDVD